MATTTLDPALRRDLIILFVAGCFFWSSLASLLPVLPLYLNEKGADEQQIGLVMGALAAGIILARASVTLLADQRGRKLVLTVGLVVGAVAPLGYGLSDALPWLLMVRAFHGVSVAAFTTGYAALVVDLIPPSQRGELVGYMSLVNPLGLGVGPALGGYLQASLGYPPVFWMSSGLALVGLACMSLLRDNPLPVRLEPGVKAPFWQLLKERRVLTPSVLMLQMGLIFGTVSTFIPLLVEDEKLAINPGLFYTTLALASFSARFFVGRASDRFGRGPFILVSLFLYVIAMGLIWLAPTTPLLLTAGFFEGFASGMLFPTILTLVADRSQPEERARTLSLSLGGFDLGIAIAGPVLGLVAVWLGLRIMFGLAAVLAVLACGTFLTQNGKNLMESLRFALGQGGDSYRLKE
ncbi:MFS transporter [Candidatus Cyanaurora vandensis]|uniref:MFS transporter n=1 Tax=Candidatus Cyanaurora vandensis TaxID=2714958 RepID=UPI00257DD69C|nr:MFS transporter [Candidatus Cyanaurora vandensis]